MLGLSQEETSPLTKFQAQQLYTTAYELYEKGDYRGAAQLFTQLVLTDPFSEHFWQGLASAKQMASDYKAALHAWALVSLLKEGDPMPHFHAAECSLSLEEKQDALKALDAALDRAGQDECLCNKIHLLKAVHYGND